MPLCAQEPSVPSTATETNAAKKGRSCKLATGSCRSAKSRGTAGVQQTFKGQAELGAEHRGSKAPCTPPTAPPSPLPSNGESKIANSICQHSTGSFCSQPSTSSCPLQLVYGPLRSKDPQTSQRHPPFSRHPCIHRVRSERRCQSLFPVAMGPVLPKPFP